MGTIIDLFSSEIEISGYWWLVDDDDLRLPGTLNYSPVNGISLDLLGNFPDEKLIYPYEIILLGESTFGEMITVHQLFRTQFESSVFQPTTGVSSYIANKAYVGSHFYNIEDAKFSRINYYPSFLERWLRLKTFDYDFRKDGFQVAFNHPDNISFDITDDLRFHLSVVTKGPGISSYDNEIRFEYKPFVSLESKEPLHWNEFGEMIVTLNNFFSLPLMQSVYPLYVEGEMNNPAKLTDEEKSKNDTIRILLPLYEKPITEGPYHFEMLFTYDDIKENFKNYLSNWFSKQDLLEPVFDLFFSSYSSNRPYVVTTFLNYVQALETYHIRSQADEIDPAEIHRKRMEEIIASVPEEHKKWVVGKLGFSNRKTLAHRLRDLININPNMVTGRAGDHNAFIKRVKDSRNYYTHYDPSMEKKAVKGGYLKGLSITLGLLIEGFLLSELGFDIEKVQEMQRNRKRLPPSLIN